MNFQKYLLSCLLITFPIAFLSRPAAAFNLIFSNGPDAYRSYEYYRTFSGSNGYVMVNSMEKLSAPNPISNAMFWSVLTSAYPTGWDFQSAGNTPLYGTFDVKTYRSCSPVSECGTETFFRVGAELDLYYQPNLEMGDPDPATGRVRWIQWVRSNHSVTSGIDSELTHGVQESVIDVSGSHGTPYFYADSEDRNKRSPYQFNDIPSRVDPDFQHDWIAQLFLAVESPQTEGSTTRTVTLYDGIEWGWLNRIFYREEQPDPVPVCPPVNNSTEGTCSSDPPPDPEPGLCFNSIEQIYEPCNYAPSSARLAPQAVPEPATAVALLAVGAWAGISWKKRKGEQNLNSGNVT